jgi:hypothetical protein
VTVQYANPQSRWELTVTRYQVDTASVAAYLLRVANDRGRWSTDDTTWTGRLAIDVLAESQVGQVCQLSTSGRVSRL